MGGSQQAKHNPVAVCALAMNAPCVHAYKHIQLQFFKSSKVFHTNLGTHVIILFAWELNNF